MTRRQTNIRQHGRSIDRQVGSRGFSDLGTVDERAGQLPAAERETGMTAVPRLLRFPDVRNRTGLSRSAIWRLERDGRFHGIEGFLRTQWLRRRRRY
jgi:hypothetical protein